MTVKIKENSFVAKVAAWKLGAKTMAITIGNTIYLHKTERSEFLNDTAWVNHELVHVLQFKRYGFFPFILLYLVESVRRGYYNNKWEVEARQAEQGFAAIDITTVRFV